MYARHLRGKAYRRQTKNSNVGRLSTRVGEAATWNSPHLNRLGRDPARENLASLQEATVSDQIAWFEDFRAWQGEDLRAEISEHAQRLADNSDKRANRLGLQLRDVVGSAGEEIGPDTLIKLLDQGRAVEIWPSKSERLSTTSCVSLWRGTPAE